MGNSIRVDILNELEIARSLRGNNIIQLIKYSFASILNEKKLRIQEL